MVRFDASLPEFIRLIVEELGLDALDDTLFIRDATGVLAAVVNRALPSDKLEELNAVARKRLGGYARAHDSIRDHNGPGATRMLGEPAPLVSIERHRVRLLDRRIVGSDWLAEPTPLAEVVPRVAFTSIKGGVGRSTSLAVASAHLASRGLRVLAVDLDLEAPGLGATLLRPDTLPRFGVLDWLVEDAISGIDNEFRADAIAPSWVGGQVHILPAFGRETRENPANALAKIARASIEDVTDDGTVIPFRQQVQAMVEACEATGDYDVVLVDGRAGLHETTAAAMLGLGARVLMFGLDEPQTFLGYRLLLAHIDERLQDAATWRDRAWFVNAKASAGDRSGAEQRFRELWRTPEDALDLDAESPSLGADDLDVGWSDEEVPLPSEPEPVLHVLDDARYRGFDPLGAPDLLSEEVYRTTFADLLTWLDEEVVR